MAIIAALQRSMGPKWYSVKFANGALTRSIRFVIRVNSYEEVSAFVADELQIHILNAIQDLNDPSDLAALLSSSESPVKQTINDE